MGEYTEQYTGWKKWRPTPDEWNEFYTNKTVPFTLLENEYLIVYDEEDNPTYYCYENGRLRQFRGGAIKTFQEEPASLEDVSGKKSSKKSAKGKSSVILARNVEQVCAIDLLKDQSKTVKLICGVWGSGKDLFMATYALEALRLGQYEKIIWVRNNVRVKDTPDLGALPGEIEDKLVGFVGPFIDAIGETSVKAMLMHDTLKIEPLQSIRGRNFANSIIICSESENMTFDQLKLLVARVAEGSCLLINGDIRQRDAAVFDKSKGLEKFITCLKGERLFGYVYFPKTERSATAQLADKLDNFEFDEKN